ncbi:predicted protein, partial [Nematostella vectensis]
MGVSRLVLLVALNVIVSPHLTASHSIPTYFNRLNPDGSLMDVKSPEYWIKLPTMDQEPLRNPQDYKGTLKVHPSVIDNGESVTVSWHSIQGANMTDFIALYCPAEDTHDRFLDYLYLNETKTLHKLGKGFVQVKLYNMRVSCEMRYFSYDGHGVPVLKARSNTVEFKGRSAIPLQGRIALTGDPTEMRVMWTSGTDSNPVVMYGMNKTLTHKATGKSSTYRAQDMCGFPANGIGFRDPGFLHDVLIADLKPATRYFYQYGSEEAMGPMLNFTTAPIPGADVPVKFVAYADMGVSPTPGAEVTARYSLEEVKNGAELVLHFGDISYARGYAYLWDKWHSLIEPYATRVPYMVGIGNHEQDHTTGASKDPSGAGKGFHPSWGNFGDDSGGECGVPMFHRFHMPDNGNALWWYSFDYGSVHFVMMSTEHNFTRGSTQYKWLEADLKAVNHKVTPWIVFMGHRPMYTSQLVQGLNPTIALHMQAEIEDLLMEYSVDLALWGHYHSYERTCPVYRNKCTSGGPTHIIVGTAGFDVTLDPWPIPARSWSVYHSSNYGYGRVTVANATAMLWEWVINESDYVADRVWLYK